MQGVVILFFALLAWGSSLSWGACVSYNTGVIQLGSSISCQYGRCGAGSSLCSSTALCASCPEVLESGSYYFTGGSNSDLNQPLCTNASSCWNYSGFQKCVYTLRCSTQGEADSVNCVSKGEPWVWNPANGTCDSLGAADTTYKCVNTTIASGTYGERPIAHIYRCITTGSSSDACERTSSLNGTCQDWGFCPEYEPNCDISKDSTGKFPCTRSGGPTTSGTRCYYQCPDGSAMACKPTGTEYVAGAIYVGVCPDRPPQSCYSSSSAAPGSSESSPGSSDSGPASSESAPPPDTIPNDLNVDYTRILQAIHDTLHHANRQRDILADWDINYLSPGFESVQNIEQYALNQWQNTNDINNQLTTLQDRPFNLSADIKQDLDSAHSLLDEINKYLRYDTLKTYATDTTYNPLLRDIKASIDSTGSVDSTYNLLRPYFADSGQYDSPITKLIKSITSNFPSRDSSTRSMCSAYYKCVQDAGLLAGFSCKNTYPNWESCIDGGTPLDGVANLMEAGLTALVKGLFGDDSTPIPQEQNDGDSNYVLPPEYSSASTELQRAIDSLGNFDVQNLTDSVRLLLDSARRMNDDTTKIQPDSLWLDSAGVYQYVDHILLPSGTGTDCFVCEANFGTFNGLTDTNLVLKIDFSDFGGYNWCEIIRAVVRIATLVTCISLTLGSWAAAFGYNPKNDA